MVQSYSKFEAPLRAPFVAKSGIKTGRFTLRPLIEKKYLPVPK